MQFQVNILSPIKQGLHLSPQNNTKTQYPTLSIIKSTQFNIQNQFIQAIQIAYAHHLPLAISPDHIWLTILQEFSRHSNTTHQQFSPQITEITFTTTTPLVTQVLKNALKAKKEPYLDYGICIHCGITQIKLLGNKEDWILIKDKSQILTQFKLDHWYKQLQPLLDEFIACFDGKINENHWSSIFQIQIEKIDRICGYEIHRNISGWIANFLNIGMGEQMRVEQVPSGLVEGSGFINVVQDEDGFIMVNMGMN